MNDFKPKFLSDFLPQVSSPASCAAKRPRFLTPALTAALSLVLTACGGSGLEIMRTQQKLREDIKDLQSRRGVECAPLELAKAESQLAFAVVEMKEGESPRAREHLSEGQLWHDEALKKVRACPTEATPPPAAPPKDSDGDGLVDSADACPDRPEDFDGMEDDDGCPDAPKDRDGDGILDHLDRCPDQAEDRDGVDDEDGCPDVTSDRDNDGIADAQDRCPVQPEDRDSFQDDDGCPDVDNDSDGLFDVVDRCPIDAEDVDGFEDQDGCPDGDNDRDSIADANDRCPTEPETLNDFEDLDGCPDTKPDVQTVQMPSRVTITGSQLKISEQVKFKVGSDLILSDSFGLLDDVAKVLKSYPKIKIRIEGHTDDQGKELANLELSKWRAASVRRYLIKAGVEETRMRAVGLGESQPLEPGISEAARKANRRVEFHITEQ